MAIRDEMLSAAESVRTTMGIPPVGDSRNGSDDRDGWLVTGGGRRFIGMLRRNRDRFDLLAYVILERLSTEPARNHVTWSFDQLSDAGYPVSDPNLVLALLSREGGPHAVVSRSSTYRCTYDEGGLDNAYGLVQRRRLRLPRQVRRRVGPANDRHENHGHFEDGRPITHQNESGQNIDPAMVRESDFLIIGAANVDLAERQLRAQVRRVFDDEADAALSYLENNPNERRAWTQLSFGRGGGGGLVRALRRAKNQSDSLGAILTDPGLEAVDSVKRARVTAGDSRLLEQYRDRASEASVPSG